MKKINVSAACDCKSGYCGQEKEKDYTEGFFDTPAGIVPLARSATGFKEKLGSWMVRWGIKRGSYSVEPGLYAFGRPKKDSPVLVTANYKKTFDDLRKEIQGINAWILVLDTNGINVWCAAGKGTFGTKELISRIKSAKLMKVVSHKLLILPQLGAPGVAAHEVKKKSGFSVIFGPVRASDLKQFLKNGYKATEEMRTIKFTMKDRAVLIPVEITLGWKFFLGTFLFALVFIFLEGKSFTAFAFREWLPYALAVITGGALVPLLLPYIPGASFAWKGWLLGVIVTALYARSVPLSTDNMIAMFLMLPAISSYIALNFTGATPFTSLSGVLKETKFAVPILVILCAAGIFFRVLGMVNHG